MKIRLCCYSAAIFFGICFCVILTANSLTSRFKKTATDVKQSVKQTVSEVVGKAEELTLGQVKNQIKATMHAIIDNPYKDTKAVVRIGNELCDGEKAYLAQRKPLVKKSLEKFLGSSLGDNSPLTIAIIGSGGGIRAKYVFTGALCAADEIGLLDATTYIVGLSGSTWAMGEWLARAQSLASFKQATIATMMKGISDDLSKDEISYMMNALLVKWAFNQPLSIVDLWGLVVGNRFFADFGDARQRVHLSSQQELVKNGAYPYPIYTAISGEGGMPAGWYEFTPHEVGSTSLGCYVPTWAFGRSFNNGESLDFAPEISFGNYLGVCGSAFAATVRAIYNDKFKNVNVGAMQPAVELIMKKIGDERLTTGVFNNFTKNISQSVMKDQDVLQLVDAGLDFNLPYSPVSGHRSARSVDVLIFVDASKTMKGAPALASAAAYARDHGLKFPPIDYTDIETRGVTIFSDANDAACPLVIYLPRIKDKELWASSKSDSAFASYVSLLDTFDPEVCLKGSYCATENFAYSKDNALQLLSLSEWNMKACLPKIKEAIKAYSQRRVAQIA